MRAAQRLKLSQRRGDTLIEVIFALAILATLLTVLTVAAVNSWRNSRLAGERTQASAYVQEQVEALRTFRRSNNWTTFYTSIVNATPPPNSSFVMQPSTPIPLSPSSWVVNSGVLNDGIYTFKTVVESAQPAGSPTPRSVKFKVTATWRSLGTSTTNSSDQLVEFTDVDN